MGEDMKPIFRDLTADEFEPETTEIESLCINCGENGTTKLMPIRIPFYKEIVVMSFSCPYCDYHNNEMQSCAKIEEKGIRIVLHVKSPEDLNREVVKSDFTSVNIPELDFEIPSQSQNGEITTVEGILNRTISDLEKDQNERREVSPDSATLIDEFIQKLKSFKDKHIFTMILRDISGNSYIQNLIAPQKDPGIEISQFVRTKEEDHALGIFTAEEIQEETGNEETNPKTENQGMLKPISEGQFSYEDFESEVITIPTNCPNCSSPCETNMKITKIPHFKEVVIMATLCEHCGLRTNEVKSSGGIEPKGIRIEVDIKTKEDLCRDVLKSDTCKMMIPELEMEVGSYALGGRFTTVEGLLVAAKEQLAEQGGMFRDSLDDDAKQRLEQFLKELDRLLVCERSATLILDDPAGNSFIQSGADEGPDDALKIILYERTFDQNEELGLTDMKTENYEESD